MYGSKLRVQSWRGLRLRDRGHVSPYKVFRVHFQHNPTPSLHRSQRLLAHCICMYIQGVPGGMCQTSGECSLR